MKFLALMVVIAVLVAAAATFGSNESHAVPACDASCSSFNTGPLARSTRPCLWGSRKRK